MALHSAEGSGLHGLARFGQERWLCDPNRGAKSRAPRLREFWREFCRGEMAEWLKAAVLKTAVRETVPGVRIPLSPPSFAHVHVAGASRLQAARGSRRALARIPSPPGSVTRDCVITITRLSHYPISASAARQSGCLAFTMCGLLSVSSDPPFNQRSMTSTPCARLWS